MLNVFQIYFTKRKTKKLCTMSKENDANSSMDMRSIHQTDIDEFRKCVESLLEKYPRYDTDYALLRWLKGWKFDKSIIIIRKLPKYSLCFKYLNF